MNWSDERYVRIYTRDTKDLMAIGWEGRLCLYELLRKVDRAGVLDTGGDMDFLHELLRIPAEIFDKGVERLLARGIVTIRDGMLAVPNFVAAQESSQSDRMRARESRAARRERAVRDGRSHSVTPGAGIRDASSHAVTRGHTVSQPVTPCLSVPCSDPPTPLEGGPGSPPSGLSEPEPVRPAKRAEPPRQPAWSPPAIGSVRSGPPPARCSRCRGAGPFHDGGLCADCHAQTSDVVAPSEALSVVAEMARKLRGGT